MDSDSGSGMLADKDLSKLDSRSHRHVDAESSGGVLSLGKHTIRPSGHPWLCRSSERASGPVKNDSPVKWMPGMADNAGGCVSETGNGRHVRWNFWKWRGGIFATYGVRPLGYDDEPDAVLSPRCSDAQEAPENGT